eukprot:jgi/Picre1/29096/NNA_004489.t1
MELVAEILFCKSQQNGAYERETGMFVGLSSTDYAKVMAKHVKGITAYTATGNTLSVASGRVSFAFDLKGPTLTVDTACSSSLVSLHAASNSLKLGQCEGALNAGANLMLSVDTPAAFAKSGMLSQDGRCKTLDSAADGYVRAEAGGAFYIQQLLAETATVPDVFSILSGTALNQDGRSSSLTAPNGPAQTRVIKSALKDAVLHPWEIDTFEMHGTGTGLGDPIEVGALSALLQGVASPKVLAAGKSLVGHSEPAAGVMGLAHIQTAVSNEAVLPILHLRALNSHTIPVLAQSAWFIPRSVAPHGKSVISEDIISHMGVSSFAFQGTNAHAIISKGVAVGVVPASVPLQGYWEKSRHWVHPEIPNILCTAASKGNSALFEVHSRQPRLANINDGVKVNGEPIVSLGALSYITEQCLKSMFASRSVGECSLGDAVLRAVYGSYPPHMTVAIYPEGIIKIRDGQAGFGIGEFRALKWTDLSHRATEQVSAGATSGMMLPRQRKAGRKICHYVGGDPSVSLDAALSCVSTAGIVVSFDIMASGRQSHDAEPSFLSFDHSSLKQESDNLLAVDGVITSRSQIPSAFSGRSKDEHMYHIEWRATEPEQTSQEFGWCVKGQSPESALAAMQQMDQLDQDFSASGCFVPDQATSICQNHDKPSALQLHGMLKSYAQEHPGNHIAMGFSTLQKTRWQIMDRANPGYGIYGGAVYGSVVKKPQICRCKKEEAEPLSRSRMGKVHHITGGSGALAGTMVGWLLSDQANTIHLSSRSGSIPGSMRGLSTFEGALSSSKCDASHNSDLVLLEDIEGCLHIAGGILRDSTITNQSLRDFRLVAAPKSVAVHKIFDATRNSRLSSYVMYSSIASMMGSPGQISYSAANAALDYYAASLENQGYSSKSVQWGAWASAGMATRDKSTSIRLERMGIGVLSIENGLRMFEKIFDLSQPVVVPYHLTGITEVNVEEVEHTMRPALTERKATEITDVVAKSVERIIGSSVGLSEPLMASGLDSLGAVELRNALETAFEVQLPSTIVFDYPTVQSMSQFIQTLFEPEVITAEKEKLVVKASAYDSRVGIVHYNENSPDSGLLFDESVDVVGTVPFDRWNIEQHGSTSARFGAFLKDIGFFDTTAFSISQSEASLIDPQQRLLLELIGSSLIAYHSSEAGSHRGVYIGLASSDYGSLVHAYAEKGAFHATSNALSVACGRISYTFGFQGPSLSIDTACSASLVATHIAARDIASGRSALSYASGAHVQCTVTSTSYVWAASMLTPSGRCKALDASADGYVRGEMCACLTLEANDSIDPDKTSLNVTICGSAVNQDGRSSSLTAPNGPSQTSVILAATQQAGLVPSDIQGLSMHGTGTSLGDPIEIGAAIAAYGKHTSDPFTFMASKAWVGHGEPAAGMAGLFLATASLSFSKLIQLTHLRNLNPYVESNLSKKDCVLLPREKSAQTQAVASQNMGVSAFAFQGTNAHAVLTGSDSAHCVLDEQIPYSRSLHYVVPLIHLFLDSVTIGSKDTTRLQARLDSPPMAYLYDHTVLEKNIFPGAGYFEASLAAGRLMCIANMSEMSIQEVSIPAPLMLSHTEEIQILETAVELCSGTTTIQSYQHGTSQTHMHGCLGRFVRSTQENLNHPMYWTLVQPMTDIFSKPAVCRLNSKTERSSMYLDPAVFDSFLQLGQVFVDGSDVYVPASVGCIATGSGAKDLTTSNESAWGVTVPLPSEDGMKSDYAMKQKVFESICSVKSLEAKSMGSHQKLVQPMKLERTLYACGLVGYEPAKRSEDMHEDFCWKLLASRNPSDLATATLEGIRSSMLQTSGKGLLFETLSSGISHASPAGPASLYSNYLSTRALGGFFRTLGQEAPQISWGIRYRSTLQHNQAVGMRKDSVGNVDQFGESIEGSILYRPPNG